MIPKVWKRSKCQYPRTDIPSQSKKNHEACFNISMMVQITVVTSRTLHVQSCIHLDSHTRHTAVLCQHDKRRHCIIEIRLMLEYGCSLHSMDPVLTILVTLFIIFTSAPPPWKKRGQTDPFCEQQARKNRVHTYLGSDAYGQTLNKL